MALRPLQPLVRLQQQTCISSRLTSRLLEWRNPQGLEENWLGRERGEVRSWAYLYKALPAEAGIVLLVISATIETVVYAILVVLARLVSRLDDGERYNFYVGRIESSAFTIGWNFDNLGKNLSQENLLTHESFARSRRDRILNRPSRAADSRYIGDWARRHGQRRDPIIRPFFSQIVVNQEATDRGAAHIIDHVLRNAGAETLTRFKEVDVDLIPFVLARAIFMRAFAMPLDQQIFRMGFKLVTVCGVLNLWHGQYSQQEVDQMSYYLSTPERFQARVDDNAHADEPLFNVVRSLATAELQNSVFISQCWQRACAILNEREAAAKGAS